MWMHRPLHISLHLWGKLRTSVQLNVLWDTIVPEQKVDELFCHFQSFRQLMHWDRQASLGKTINHWEDGDITSWSVRKSTEMCDQGRQALDCGCRRPAGSCLGDLAIWQDAHWVTYWAMSGCSVVQQKEFAFKDCMLAKPGCPAAGKLCIHASDRREGLKPYLPERTEMEPQSDIEFRQLYHYFPLNRSRSMGICLALPHPPPPPSRSLGPWAQDPLPRFIIWPWLFGWLLSGQSGFLSHSKYDYA